MAKTPPSVMSMRFEEPEELTTAIKGAVIDPCRLGRHPAPSQMTRIQCPKLCLDLITVGSPMLYSGEMPADCYTLSFVMDCPGVGRSFNFGTDFGSGFMGFFPPSATLDATNPADCDNVILTVPRRDFHAMVAIRHPEIPDHVLTHGAAMRVAGSELHQLRRLISDLRQILGSDRGPLSESSCRCRLADELFGVFMCALKRGCEDLIANPKFRVARRHQRFRQARDFLAAHQHQPVSLADLCAELSLSERGVENLFRDYLGTGPNVYLRHRRLHQARRALLAARSDCGVVKRVALESGFWHLGRFARNYQGFFRRVAEPNLVAGTIANKRLNPARGARRGLQISDCRCRPIP